MCYLPAGVKGAFPHRKREQPLEEVSANVHLPSHFKIQFSYENEDDLVKLDMSWWEESRSNTIISPDFLD